MTYSRFKPDYEKYARQECWSRDEAILYFWGIDPYGGETEIPIEVYGEIDAEEMQAMLDFKDSSDRAVLAGTLEARNILKNEKGKITNYTVSPKDFVEWADGLGYSAPERLIGFLKEKHKNLKYKSINLTREQCRTLASYLWSKDPTINITRMVAHPDLAKFSDCRAFTAKTVRQWIKDLCPNPTVGRPRKSKVK